MLKLTHADTPPQKHFEDLKNGDLFFHRLGGSVFMKKTHKFNSESYESIDLHTGQSMHTSDTADCYLCTIKGVVTLL